MGKKMDRLTLDCIAAQRAGMSYGQWKALHPRTEKVHPGVQEEEPVAPKQLCVVCGKEIPYRPSGSGAQPAKCCSKECSYERHKWRQRMYVQRKKERMMADGKI